MFAATSATEVRVAASDAGVNPSIVESSGALPTPTQSLPLVGTSVYVTVAVVVAPARTHAWGRSTVPSNTWLVMPVCGEVTRAAVIACGPAGRVRIASRLQDADVALHGDGARIVTDDGEHQHAVAGGGRARVGVRAAAACEGGHQQRRGDAEPRGARQPAD